MKNHEKMTHDVFQRMEEYKAAQKKKKKMMIRAATGAICVCLIALMSIGVWRSGMLTTPPITLDDNSTVSNNPGKGDHKTPGNHGGVQSNPPANSQGDNPSDPAVTDPPVVSQTIPYHSSDPGGEPSGVPSDNPGGVPSGNPGGIPGGNPNAVQQLKVVSYQEAKDLFEHPIVECFESNFMNYEIVMVSQRGDWNGYYFGVHYIFSDGEISLIDQDRLKASVFSVSDLYDKIEYNGHTFFAKKENYLPDFRIEIWYCPKVENHLGVGIAYSAHFDKSVDLARIMDLLLSLEIKQHNE